MRGSKISPYFKQDHETGSIIVFVSIKVGQETTYFDF